MRVFKAVVGIVGIYAVAIVPALAWANVQSGYWLFWILVFVLIFNVTFTLMDVLDNM